MRPFTPIKAAPIAACTCAVVVLSLLVPTAAGASEAANLFGGGTQSSTQGAKSTQGAGKVSVQTAKQPAVGAKSSQSAPKGSSAASTPKVPTGTTTAATQETASTSSSTMIVAVLAGVLLLGGVAFVIVRDARAAAPVVEGMATGGTRNPEGRLRRRRAQAKAARRQRKRHRKR